MDATPEPALRERLTAIVGAGGLLTGSADMAPYLVDERKRYRGAAQAVVRPSTTDEVARVVALCAEGKIPIVPQGGNTGLCGAATPDSSGRALVLSLARLNRVREVDPLNYTITVEAGVILADVQNAAAEVDRLFPLSLGGEGTARIGGNLSTNAGGTGVLRYGNARDLALGLEVVLPDGRVWDGLSALRKDNTGYDLKHLFIGAEGTLGIITAAVLKLFPRPRAVETALVAIDDPAAAVELLARARAATGDRVTAFELILRLPFEMTIARIEGTRDPFAERHPCYVLAELSAGSEHDDVRGRMESLLAEAMEDGLVRDAVIAESGGQAADFWKIRETVPEAQTRDGISIKHDVSVPVSRIPAFMREAAAAAETAVDGVRVCAFGHVGDGNLHFNMSQPAGGDGAAFLARESELNAIVHDAAARHGGSISAEHGIGQLKREALVQYKPGIAIDLMRRIKQALDPDNLMNPGKVLDPPDSRPARRTS
ncbi:MAG: FAD-binding oxidoreductase [Defluviicoccus sp.]|nr:FAD-binding oxidoreductase [Defluviicoccus sp.]